MDSYNGLQCAYFNSNIIFIVINPFNLIFSLLIEGSSICVNPNCYSGIGPVKRYKRDARELGYVISAKTILYRIKGSRAQTLKKWKNAPFKVHEEVVG